MSIHATTPSGNIVNVLSQWSLAPVPINALYPSRKYIPMKVKVFVGSLSKRCDRMTSRK
ncbi:hypothetical protein [Nostoc sp. DSM 114160]